MNRRVFLALTCIVAALDGQSPVIRERAVPLPPRSVEMAKPPALPLALEDDVPQSTKTVALNGRALVYDSWRDPRSLLARLKSGDQVSNVAWVCIVTRPSVFVARAEVPQLGLVSGDRVLMYRSREGFASLWFKGRWYRDEDISFMGGGCTGLCLADVVERGKETWWIRLRLSDGRVGWTPYTDSILSGKWSN